MNSRFHFSVLDRAFFLTFVGCFCSPLLLHADQKPKKSAPVQSPAVVSDRASTPVLPSSIPLKYARELIVGGRPVPRPNQTQKIEKGKHIVGRSDMTRGQKERMIGKVAPPTEPSKQCFKFKLVQPLPAQTLKSGGKHLAFIVFDAGGKAGALDTQQRMVIEVFSRDGVKFSQDLFFAEDWAKAVAQGSAGLEVMLNLSPGLSQKGSVGPTVLGRSLFTFCPTGKKGQECGTSQCDFQLALSSR